MTKPTAAAVKAALRKKPKPRQIDWDRDGLSLGSAVLNLACTGRTKHGIAKGFYALWVGDTDSGKTFFTLALLAEAANNPAFKDHRLIYNGNEKGAQMDLRKHFGSKLADRIEMDRPSGTVEEFYDHLDDLLDAGEPFVEVLDSIDGLDTEAALAKAAEQKVARRKGRESAGSYGDGKAKQNSSRLRNVIAKLERSGSILVMINQTRDNIGFGSQFNPKTRSGGHALAFYAAIQLWSSRVQKLKKTVRGKQVQTGIVSRIHVKRSRFTGRDVSVDVPIHWSSGIDDTGSMVDYLVEWRHWKETKGVVTAPEFKLSQPREELVGSLEVMGHEKALRMLVAETWADVEAACRVERKKRYE